MKTIPILVIAALLGQNPADSHESEQKAVDYMVVVTGGELLAGAFPDGHTFFLTRTLNAMGMHCVGSMCVDDRRDDIQDAVRFASERVRLVIVTGGLGPTDNDITRETLSELAGIPLAENEQVLQQMEEHTRVSRDRLPSNLRRQARVPTRGTYLGNGGGTAVGLVFDDGKRVIVSLPGPPRELKPMVTKQLVPWLSKRFGVRPPGATLTVRFVGLGQSQVDRVMDEHIPLDKDIVLQSQFDAGRVDFTFSLPGDTAEDRARLARLEGQIQQYLGDHIYGTGAVTLEERVVQLMSQYNVKLAIADCGSGGALTAALMSVPDAKQTTNGATIATDMDQLGRLLNVDPNIVQSNFDEGKLYSALAAKTATKHKADWAMVIGGWKPSPTGEVVVNVAIHAGDKRVTTQRIATRGSSLSDRAYLVTKLLDLLRKSLLRADL